jgi:hypothetical protein
MPLDPNGFYANLQNNLVYPLLQQFGFSAAIQVKAGEVFNPVTGMITTPATWYVFPCVAVYGGGGSGERPGVSTETEGKTLNRVTKKEVFLDASLLTITPTPDDLFQDEVGNTWEIRRVEPTNPGGVTVMWKITAVR